MCGKGFACAHDLVEHCDACHGNYKEYRKRILFLAKETGLAKILDQSKSAMIQNVAQFQTQSVPGLQATDWPRLDSGVSAFQARKEIACAACARLKFLEKLESVFLSRETENLDPEQYSVVSAAGIDKILSVYRYASRWPLIPSTELHASSIIHPLYPHMRWLLHTRVVKIKKNILEHEVSLKKTHLLQASATNPNLCTCASSAFLTCVRKFHECHPPL